MKLIHCKKCGSIYNLTHELKSCSCGKTAGLYIDDEDVVYGGSSATCLGIDNSAFGIAISNQNLDGFGIRFDSYICALYCGSTIKIKGLEKMSESEIYNLILLDKPKQKRGKKVHIKRQGITRFLYLLCKKIMDIEIKKMDKEYLELQSTKWYSDFSERVLSITKRLSVITGKHTRMDWFEILMLPLAKNPKILIEWEKIKYNKVLYNKIYKHCEKFKEEYYTIDKI